MIGHEAREANYPRPPMTRPGESVSPSWPWWTAVGLLSAAWALEITLVERWRDVAAFAWLESWRTAGAIGLSVYAVMSFVTAGAGGRWRWLTNSTAAFGVVLWTALTVAFAENSTTTVLTSTCASLATASVLTLARGVRRWLALRWFNQDREGS